MINIRVFLLILVFASTCFYSMFSLRHRSKIRDGFTNYEGDVNTVDNVLLTEGIRLHKIISQNYSLEAVNCSRQITFLSIPKPLIALASFPGSGNTWTRLLLETTTGTFTGSVYREAIYVGSKECPARGKVEIVKTHRSDYSARTHQDCVMMNISLLEFSSAIYILRNPYNALLAEFNRQQSIKAKSKNTHISSKVGIAAQKFFDTTEWSKFVARMVVRWRNLTLYWINKKDIPVFLVVYERLIENVQLEIMNLMKFLGYRKHTEYMYITCLSGNQTRVYKRNKPKWLKKEHIYKSRMRKMMNSLIIDVINNIDSKLNISSILQTYLLAAN